MRHTKHDGCTHHVRSQVVTALALAGLLTASQLTFLAPVASAAPLVTGTVTNDANANGVVDTAMGTGGEAGLAGVTVELHRVSDDSLVTSTVTAAGGAYSLDATSAGDYYVTMTAPSGFTVGSSAGAITRTSPTTGRSADLSIAADTMVDALIRPDFELTLGYLNNPDGIITGAAPFDTSDPGCVGAPGVPTPPTVLNDVTTPPGVDCTKYDDTVRSGDNVAFNFAISGSAADDTVETVSNVVIQQTITPTGGAIINFARIPLSCVPPTGGSGGTPPPYSMVEYFDGAGWVQYSTAGYLLPQDLPAAAVGKPLRLTCNKGTYTTGDASTLGTTVRIDPTSPNGSSFTSEGVVFAANTSGVATAVPDGPLAAPAIEIKARPEWDLRKSGFYRQDWTTYDPPGATPSGPGFFTYFNIMLGSDKKAGNEPLAMPITLDDQLWGFKGDGTTPEPLVLGVDYFMLNCLDFWPENFGNFGGNVISRPSLVTSSYSTDMAVQNSGTCSVNGSTGQITWDGVDFGGPYPTKTNTGQSLAAGPYLVANKWIQLWFPLATLDKFNGIMGDQAGSGFLWNRITGFDPVGVSGNSNYGNAPGQVEPGWCDPAVTPTAANTGCNALPMADLLTSKTLSNDVAGPTSFVFSPGYFAKYLLKPNGAARNYYHYHDDSAAAHDGAGTIQPGQYTSTWHHWLAYSSAYENPAQCDIWDNSMYQLVTLGEAHVADDYGAAWMGKYAIVTGANIDPGTLTYEYAHIDFTGDDPLDDHNLLTTDAIDGATGRYLGDWTAQRSANCDAPGVVWSTDPAAVPGGVDAVNAVRVTGADANDPTPATPNFGPGSDRLLRVGLRARDVFYGGPHAGDPIPAQAVGANYGKIKVSNVDLGGGLGNYSLPSYIASPETTATDGDRLTWTRAVLGIKKRTIALDGLCDSPCAADYDVNGAVLAGQQIVWEMQPVVNAASSDPALVPGIVIKDVLPEYIEYDDACTLALTGGTPAADVQLNTPLPGQTTLLWFLPSVMPNEPLEPLRICTGTDPLAPAPTSVVNRVEMSTTAIPTSHPFDTHTLTLEQSGDLKLRKTVDAPLDVLNDDQVWTISYANFSETVAVQPVRTIEVFPYLGDATPPGGPTRNPASSFDGALVLTTAIAPKYADGSAVPGTVYYTADAPGTINQNWNLNTTNWCTFDGATFTSAIVGTPSLPCPTSLATVTGWMFNETNVLVPTTDPTKNRVNIQFTLQAGDTADPLSAAANQPNNVYTDRFTAFSNTFVKAGLPQRLSSNTVRVRTLGFSAGDFVYDDRNGDGAYTDGVDVPVPDGVTINLYYVPAAGPAVLFDTTVTDGGTYLFTDLPEGDFYVEIPASFFGVGQPLEGWDISPTPASAPSAVEENDDVSHDAVPGTAGAVKSNTFHLSATVSPTGSIRGDEPLAEGIHGVVDPTLVTDGFANFAVDLALHSPVVSIGDRVWLDVDRDGRQDVGEAGIEDVEVTLLSADGSVEITSTTTGADGFYSFTDLPYSTSYQVHFVLPNGYHFTTRFAPGGVMGDSNADITTGNAPVITPVDGANSATAPDEPTIDAGLVQVDLVLAKELTTTGNYWPGKEVTFELTPSNIGSTDALAGWSVTDLLPTGLELVSMEGAGAPSTYTCTDATCVSSVPLGAGATGEVIMVTATIGAGVTGPLHNVAYVSPDQDEVTEIVPLVEPTTDTDTDTDVTNNDAQASLTSQVYDLALAKSVDTAVANLGDTLTYTITVANQGTLPSGDYTVVDVLPAGLATPAAISNGGVWDGTARTITWSLSGLAAADPDATVSLTYTTSIEDLSKRPWRNIAEITADSGALWGGDTDSTPDAVTTNDGDYNTAGVDNASITDAGVAPDPEDDADIAVVNTDATYDLALAKTNVVTGTGEAAEIEYSIEIANQGDVPSRAYTMVDVVPAGLAVDTGSISHGGVYDATAGTITWDMLNLAPDATVTISWSATIADLAERPFRNVAEITEDGAAFYGLTDTDSTPDVDVTNDGDYDTAGVDNESIADAGVDPDPEDDADIADADIPLTYDLALAKSASVATVDPDGTVTFTIEVANQGDVNSGDFTVVDTLPAGMAVVSASDGGDTSVAGQVTWMLTDLAPGATRSVTVEVEITDLTQRPFKNVAEITEDGADDYDSPNPTAIDPDVEDADSTPDTDPANDNAATTGDGYGTLEHPLLDVLDTDEVDTVPNGEDDADVAFVDSEVLYDLALVKTGPAAINGEGTAVFQIAVLNQGNVPSGEVTVQDVVPAGLLPLAASDGGTVTGQTVEWEIANLDPGASATFTLEVSVSDWSTRPWSNVAEIVADGADDYDTDGYETPEQGDVEDDDSVPDVDTANDVVVDQTALPATQHNDPTVDEDDHDIAPLSAVVEYDLALIKSLPAGQRYKVGDNITFTIVVKNQGNVDSGPISLQDVIPAGLTFVSATEGGLNAGQVVSWTLGNLTPGEKRTVTLVVKMADASKTSYINVAEITSDGADEYDAPGLDIEDQDSTPDDNIANDQLVDTDDVDVDQVPGDEDDHDRALLDPTKVRQDNPKRTTPGTGSNTTPLLVLGAGLTGLGVLAMLFGRRRRRPV